MMSPNIAVLFTLAIALIGVSPPSPAQDSASTPESVAASEVTPPRATDTKPEFDPALLGLSALTASPNSAERIEQALKQVDDRLAKIKQQNVPSNANQPQDEQPSDPRLEPLQALRLSLQRRATLLARHRELESSLADQKATQGTLQHEGEVKEPPHPVDELDQLYDEHRLAKHAAKAAERDLEAAQRQADTASKNVEDKDQERRLARSRLEQADPKTDVTGLERQLETTRLDVLAPRQGFAAAKEDLEVTRLDADLTRQRADLLSAKIARMKDDVSFTQAMLDKPFAELKARETQIHQRTWTLTRTANQAEGALFDARQDLAHNQDETRTPLLEEKVAARETELESARKGIAYLDDALASIASARTLWERRYQLHKGAEETQLAAWLTEVGDLTTTIGEETRYIQSEISTLRSMQLALAQRLGDSGLAQTLRAALERRRKALNAQEDQAEELLGVEDQLSALAARFEQELDPLVSRRTIAQRLADARLWLSTWWNRELFVFQDQGFYLRDIISGGFVFVVVILAVALLKRLLSRTVLPRMVAAGNGEKRAFRALVLALVRNTSQLFVVIIAFAVQNILADIFNSMAIILDKPFRVGDFVVTDSTLGVVEQIGVKTTRIRSLSGEQVTLSNTDVLKSRIRNYKRMEDRRAVFKLGVVYQTSPEQLERIPEIIERIIREQPYTRFDRAHFFEYGDFALLFEIVYYVQGPDYNRYMDIQQAINLGINRRFREEGIEFAYPTQELILRGISVLPEATDALRG